MAPPDKVSGIEQMSYDGASFASLLAADDTAPAEHRSQQYYECWGARAVYADGWKAVTDHVNQLTAAERDAVAGSSVFSEDRWQLFHTAEDFSESTDLADSHPEKLAEMVALWDAEAERNQVLPIDDGRENRMAQMHLPWASFRSQYRLRPGDKVHEANGPVLFLSLIHI